MAKLADLVPKGFTLISPRPQEEVEVQANPELRNAALTAEEKAALPQTVTLGTGRYYVVVQGPDGQQRALFIKAQPIPSWEAGKPPIQAPVTGQNVDAQGNPIGNAQIFKGDLNTLEWDQAGPIGDVPRAADQASALADWVKLDAQGNVIPPGSTTKPATLVDPKNPVHRIDLTKVEPGGTVTPVGDYFVLVKPDGTSTTVVDENGQPRRKPTEKSQFNVAGIGLVEYDPATSTTKVLQPVREPTRTLDPDKTIWTDIPGSDQQQGNEVLNGQLTPIPGYTRPKSEGKPTTLYNDPNSPYLIWYDDQGKEVARADKPGYNPPRTQLTPDTISDFVPFWNPQTNKIEFHPNENQVKASQAVSDLAKSLGVNIAAGSMSEQQAQNIITGAVNSMNARTSALTGQVGAAGETLSQIQQGAQTGAGILQNRVSQATGLLQNVGGLPLQGTSPRLNMPSEESVRGMISGISGMTTELGGGPGVFEAAANLVQRADPANRLGANAQQAYAGLADATAKFQQLTGRLPPLAQAAAQPMPQGVGYTPPVTAGALGPTTPVPNPVAQPPPGMPKRIVQPKRPQPMNAFGPTAIDDPYGRMSAMGWRSPTTQGAAPVTININSPA